MQNNFNNSPPNDDAIKEMLYQISNASDNSYRKSCEE